MSSKIFDDFQEMFRDESEFIDSIRDMENNSEWLPEIPRKELQVIPLDGPMFVADAVAKYGVDHDTAHDTAVNDFLGRKRNFLPIRLPVDAGYHEFCHFKYSPFSFLTVFLYIKVSIPNGR